MTLTYLMILKGEIKGDTRHARCAEMRPELPCCVHAWMDLCRPAWKL